MEVTTGQTLSNLFSPYPICCNSHAGSNPAPVTFSSFKFSNATAVALKSAGKQPVFPVFDQ
jgi:hypothetical protein